MELVLLALEVAHGARQAPLQPAHDSRREQRPARIDVGSATNTVPDHAILRCNLRPRRPQERRLAVRKGYELQPDRQLSFGVGLDPRQLAFDLRE